MLRKKIIVVTLILLVAWIISDYIKITNIKLNIQSTKSATYELPQQASEGSIEKEKNNTEVETSTEEIVVDTENYPIDETLSGEWYYDQLTRNQKAIFSVILNDSSTIQEKYVKFIGANLEDVERVIKFIFICDMHITGIDYAYHTCDYDEQSISIKITLNGDASKKQIERAKREGDKIIDKIKQGTEEEVIWKIYKYLAENVKYDETASKKYTRDLYGAIVKKECVCVGYAKAFNYLCNKVGIKAITIDGYEHKWNYVQLSNKKWYAIDVTFGINNKKQYFMRGTDFLDDDHIPEDDFEVPVLSEEPLCPDSEEAKEIKAHLKQTISICEKEMKDIWGKENYEALYELDDEVKTLASEILERIRNSLFNSYINTEEYSNKNGELNSKIDESNCLGEEFGLYD